MGHRKGWLALLLAVITAGLAWSSLDWRTESVGAAPLAQATATNTPTPGPAFAQLGGVNILAPHATAGGNLLGVDCQTCSAGSSSAYAPGTVVPVQPNGAVAAQTPMAVSPIQTQIPGVYTTAVVANPTVNLTPVTTPQIAAKAERLYLICTNDSDTGTIYLSVATTAALNQGIRLNPGGASFEMSERLGNLWRGGVWAASATAGAVLTCVEGSR